MKMKTTMKANKTHGLFYSLVKQLPNYNAQFKDVIKEGLVSEFTKGQTESLSEMYERFPVEYSRMIEAMKKLTRKEDSKRSTSQEGEIWRKRCIAAVCGWLDLRGAKLDGKQAKTSYAIAVICRAASCSNFNLITVERLTDIYNEYLRKQKVVVNAAPITDFEICEN